MGEMERFDILQNEKISKNVYRYLENFFDNLNIEIIGKYKGDLFNLMKRGKLEGWCWQTTESAALFMPDDAIIYRGNLYFNDYKTYYHSFIQFNYKNKKYVFDPCLDMVNTSNLYFNTFNVDIKGQVTAKEVKEYFINYINNPPKKKNYYDSNVNKFANDFMKQFFGEDYLEAKKEEIVIYDKEDPSAPMYRNGSGYRDINIKKNKVKSLTVHYYLGG